MASSSSSLCSKHKHIQTHTGHAFRRKKWEMNKHNQVGCKDADGAGPLLISAAHAQRVRGRVPRHGMQKK
jgi:hypothetical protein